MIDGVMDFDDVISKMQKSMRGNRGNSAALNQPERVAVTDSVNPIDLSASTVFQTRSLKLALQLLE